MKYREVTLVVRMDATEPVLTAFEEAREHGFEPDMTLTTVDYDVITGKVEFSFEKVVSVVNMEVPA